MSVEQIESVRLVRVPQQPAGTPIELVSEWVVLSISDRANHASLLGAEDVADKAPSTTNAMPASS
jgi:hypothetical protein